MRLEIADAVGVDGSISQQPAQQRGLRRLIGQREAYRPPGRIDARGENHALNRITIAQRIIETLEDHHRPTLGADITIGPAVEGMATAGGAEHAGPGKATKGEGAEQHVHAAHQSGWDAPQAQRLSRVMQRHQGGGTGGVDALRRAAQVEDIAHPIGDDRERPAGHHIAVGRCRVELAKIGPIGGAGTHIDAKGTPGDIGLAPASILTGFTHQFEDQLLLRVHLRRFAQGNAEGGMVETQHIAQHAGGKAIGLARFLPARMQPGGLAKTLGRDFGHRVAPRSEQRPEGGHIRRAWQAAGRPHNGDRHGGGWSGGRRISGRWAFHRPSIGRRMMQ